MPWSVATTWAHLSLGIACGREAIRVDIHVYDKSRAYQWSQPKWPVFPMGAHSGSKPMRR